MPHDLATKQGTSRCEIDLSMTGTLLSKRSNQSILDQRRLSRQTGPTSNYFHQFDIEMQRLAGQGVVGVERDRELGHCGYNEAGNMPVR